MLETVYSVRVLETVLETVYSVRVLGTVYSISVRDS